MEVIIIAACTWRVFENEKERAWRFCYWASNTKFPLVTTGEREHICNDDFLTRKWEPDWRACNLTSGADFPFPSHNITTGTLEDQHLSAEDGLGTLEPPEDQHSNVTIICQYCRATAAALEKESDTTQMSLRLSMLKHYQCPFLHVNQNTSSHPYVTQDSAQVSENNEPSSSSYHQ